MRRRSTKSSEENHFRGLGFFSLWIGPTLGPLEVLTARSYVSQGADLTIYTYGALEGVPDGVTLADANEIIPHEEIFQNPFGSGSYAGFSNLFRYRALRLLGGTWIDMDMFFLGGDVRFGEYFLAYEGVVQINGAILRAPQQSDLLVWLENTCRQRIKTGFKWGELGPKLITAGVERFDLWNKVSPAKVAYAVSYRDAWRFCDPSSRRWVESMLRGATFVHFWKEVMPLSPDSETSGPRVPPNSWIVEQARSLQALNTESEFPVDFVRKPRRRGAAQAPAWISRSRFIQVLDRISPGRSPFRLVKKIRR